MSVTAIVGSQWGDEAKGKIVDLLSDEADIVCRFNGGDNAGHTVINQIGTFKLRLVPNGFSNPQTACVIGPGVVINLATLAQEIALIQSKGIDLSGRLWVSPRCHVIMPYHPRLEAIYEQAKGSGRTGTTGRGIGPVYADKVSYNGIRLFDLADEDVFAEKLRAQLGLKNAIFEAYNAEPLDFEVVKAEKLEQFRQVSQFVHEPFGMLQEALKGGKRFLLEGAQAALLDNDWGTYPFVTASTTLAGGSAAGLGIAPRHLQRVIGVTKAYLTRVGSGPMPTELHGETGAVLSREGQEFGTVTGRPRRCGWFDAELVRFTAQLNGLSELALMKLDVLDTFSEIKICTGYRMAANDMAANDMAANDMATNDRQAEGGPNAHYWQGDARWLEGCQPVYESLEGWRQPTRQARRLEDLPAAARRYIERIEELSGVPVSIVSVGPRREETIRVDL